MTEAVQHRITVVRYSGAKEEWDSFVEKSRNGTFLHKRGYMEYHSDRFEDHSLLFYSSTGLVAVLPAHITGNCFCSHKGLTYGGLLLSETATAETVLEIFAALHEHLIAETNADTIIYKPTPHIYHKYPCEEDLYALFRNGARLTECKISSVIRLSDPLPAKGRRKLTNAMRERLRIVEDSNFAAFWPVLQERLKEKYGASPVHSLEEIEMLYSRFPENILLFRVTNTEDKTLGGIVLYITDRTVHTQYIGTTDEGRRIGVLDYLYGYIINERFAGYDYLDFGTSVENGGLFLNSGLISQKERLGGRAVVYSTYSIDIMRNKR